MAVLVVIVVVVVCISSALLKWNSGRYKKKGVPPGTMGWPLLGETSEFLKQGPDFMKKKRAMYGSLFKSHILGCPTVVSMSAEVNRHILMREGRGVVPGYPQSMLDILGKCNIAAVDGLSHKHLRASLLSLITPNLSHNHSLLPKLDSFFRSHLSSLSLSHVIDLQHQTKRMALLSSLNLIAGIAEPMAQPFISHFSDLVLGTLSLPINLPGTSYRRGIQARRHIVAILTQLIHQRRAASGEVHQDMLHGLIHGKYKLTDEEIVDQIITIVYSGYETVSTTSMMALKYLHDQPRALHQLRREHVAIKERKNPDDPINWDDFKSMTFTRAVIYETSRLATIVNGVLRKTTQEMQLNGYVVPKGWRIYVYTRELNYDPFTYQDPLSFNPWRWLDKSVESQNNLLVFGGGARQCPGKELGIAEISVFLHYFVTGYKWEEIGGDKVIKFPRVEGPNGLRIRVSSY